MYEFLPHHMFGRYGKGILHIVCISLCRINKSIRSVDPCHPVGDEPIPSGTREGDDITDLDFIGRHRAGNQDAAGGDGWFHTTRQDRIDLPPEPGCKECQGRGKKEHYDYSRHQVFSDFFHSAPLHYHRSGLRSDLLSFPKPFKKGGFVFSQQNRDLSLRQGERDIECGVVTLYDVCCG